MLSPVVVGPGKPHQQMHTARPESKSGSRNQRCGQGCAHRAAEGRHHHDEGCRRQQEPYEDSPPQHRQKHAAEYLGEGEGTGGQRRRGSGQTPVDVVGDLVETYPAPKTSGLARPGSLPIALAEWPGRPSGPPAAALPHC